MRIAKMIAAAAYSAGEHDPTESSTIQQICELERRILELQLQARKAEAEVEVLHYYIEQLEETQLSKQNIESLKHKKMRLPSAPRIKIKWRVKPTIRARLPYH